MKQFEDGPFIPFVPTSDGNFVLLTRYDGCILGRTRDLGFWRSQGYKLETWQPVAEEYRDYHNLP